jgi:molybdopterin/thiamine biosynthesis adenylyltransferase
MTNQALFARQLDTARAVVIGVGGLGCSAAAVLSEEGVGTLRLVDPDRVEVSNLHRQVLYADVDVGRPKVEAAANRLRRDHPDVRIEARPERFGRENTAILSGADVIVDGTDSVAAKFLVNDAAVAAGIPLVHAGAVGFTAQIMTILPGASACYRCLFESPPPEDEVPSCEDAGILGPVVALAGALQAAEALRILRGEAPSFAGRVASFDGWTGTWRSVPVAPRTSCATCGPPPMSLATRSHAP